MSEAKFTKGNWVIVSDENSIEIAELEKNWHICNMNSRCDNSIHDANLIAAAPELYGALERLKIEIVLSDVDMAYIDSHFKPHLERAGRALAKARGEI